MAEVSAWSAGWGCRCPNCGEGALFDGFLKFKRSCSACEADFSAADSGDGPSFFVMFAALIIFIPLVMVLELVASPPVWVHILIWPALIVAFCLALLRPFKAIMFALQWKHHSGPTNFQDHS